MIPVGDISMCAIVHDDVDFLLEFVLDDLVDAGDVRVVGEFHYGQLATDLVGLTDISD